MNEVALSGDIFEDVVLDSLLRSAHSVQHFFFPGTPVPLARQRSAAIKTDNGKYRAIAFTPKQNLTEKKRIYAACLRQNPQRWLPPYTVAIKFICEPLKTVAEKYPVSQSHGDTDNLMKLIFDSLFFDATKKNNVGDITIWQDDSNIVNTIVMKRLPRAGEVPGIHLWLVK